MTAPWARSIVEACRRVAPRLAQALNYVAADYQPCWLQSPGHTSGWDFGSEGLMGPKREDKILGIQRVKAEGLQPFQNGCWLYPV